MLIVEASKPMRWVGYGVRLVPGENRFTGQIPPGLLASFRRHEKAGSIKLRFEEGDAGESPTADTASTPAPHAQQQAGKKKRKKGKRH